MGTSHSRLNVKIENIRIMLAGPASREAKMRGLLDGQIYRRMRAACPAYFSDSGLTARFARKIAQKTPFQAWKNPRRRKEFLSILSLDVLYANGRKGSTGKLRTGWKWWVKIRDDSENLVIPGEAV
jgi:hypothetical protein